MADDDLDELLNDTLNDLEVEERKGSVCVCVLVLHCLGYGMLFS